MATKTTANNGPVETTEAAEPTHVEIVDTGIRKIVADHGIDIQKARYKAMRAIAWQAFIESIEAGDFEELVNRASGNVDNLPSGWELTAEHKPAAKSAPAKKAPVNTGARKR
jgi:hypothetical protein